MIACVRRCMCPLVVLACAWSAVVSAQPQKFEVGAGFLSSSVRELVESRGWSLVWKAAEDRMVEFPFSVDLPEGSEEERLRLAIANLLEEYEGQFVADMYRGNRVVVIDTPPPNVAIKRPLVLTVATSGGEETRQDAPAPEDDRSE